MRLMTIHADFMEVNPMKQAIKDAEKCSLETKRYNELLVVFMSVEAGDDDVAKISEKTVGEIEKVSEQVKTKKLLLYPLVHLTSKPSAPKVALEVLLKCEKELKAKGYDVDHSPFGWYKGYTLKCKGHPLSELSRELTLSGDVDLNVEKTKKAALETAAHLLYDIARKELKKEFVGVSGNDNGVFYSNWWSMKNLKDEEVHRIVNEANKLVEKGAEIKIEFTTREDAIKQCGSEYEKTLPKKAEKIRLVRIGDLPPEPCKNAHLPNINLIKKIKVLGIERTEADLKVKFSIDLSTEMEGSEISESLKKEAAQKSHLHILDLDGKLHDIDTFNFGHNENLKKFATYETKKVRAYEKEPVHIKIMKEQDLVDYEPGSDSGNFRFMPKGKLVKGLLEDAITEVCVRDGAMEVETPIMYDFEHPALKKYLNRFPARQYKVISEDKTLFLRFAACFGQFLMAHDMALTYKLLPMKMFELTRYSFRREQSGELAGLKRLRAFTMPDMHTFAKDFDQAKKEFEHQYDLSLEWMKGLGLESEVGFRVQEDFFNENKDWYVRMVNKAGKPILIELFKERYAYFVTKFEFNFVDEADKASALSTVQIDVENCETYDIRYVDEDGTKKGPLILHASISGSLERVMYALLEKQAMEMKKGHKAMLPIWLAPTQVRVIPVSQKQDEFCRKLLEKFEGKCVRVDLDDKDETLGKKIRGAEMEWVPFIVVVGEKEIAENKFAVTVRKTGAKGMWALEQIIEHVEKENQGKPFRKLSLPDELSKRPKFR